MGSLSVKNTRAKFSRLGTFKKGHRFSRPQPGCHLLNSAWPGIIKLVPARESLVSDIRAGDRKIVNLFLQCKMVFALPLKVHKIENFFGSDFELYTISLLVMLKY
jgi:hypothetical protein